MNRVYSLTLLLLLLSFHSLAADNFPSIIGQWQVGEIYSSHTTLTDRSEVGIEIKIAKDGVTDPLLGGDAPGKVGFREESAAHAQELIKKLNPLWLKGSEKGVTLVSITSDGIDFMLLMVLPDGSLAQFSEGDVVYRLVRKKNK